MSWPRTASTSVLGRRFYVRLDASKRLIGSATASSSGTTLSISVPSGTSDGDLALYAGCTRNNIPNVAGPEGGGWTALHRRDADSNEWGFVYWKMCDSSEPGTWDLSLGSSTSSTVNAIGAALVFRGVSSVSFATVPLPENGWDVLTAPSLASDSGVVVSAYMSSFDANAFTLSESASFDVTHTYDGGLNPRLYIGYESTYLRGNPPWLIRTGLPPTSSTTLKEFSHTWTALLT